MKSFSDIAHLSGLKRTKGLNNYFSNQIFDGISLGGKRLLDIGGGNGLASFWCILEGGCWEATVLDPFDDGSHKKMQEQFQIMKNESGLDKEILLFNGILKDLGSDRDPFDIVLMHNSVNHIDEAATRKLSASNEAKKVFLEEFQRVRNNLVEGGILIVSDCSNRNFFSDMGLKNPLAPTIDWRAHQSPKVWSAIIEPAGFEFVRKTWTTRREFGSLGHKILGNNLGSYITTSHFALEFRAISHTV